jgi:serine/threonine-protein kinase
MKIRPGVIISNRYEIIEQIGSGGMAIVYKAKDKKLGRVVTFKVLRSEYVEDEDFVRQFGIEARAAASLSHQNIVSVYDVGHDGLIYYIVMEFIDGITLKEMIKRRAPFSNEETITIAIQLASALSHAHENNVVHRDIKPQNILITNSGRVKITDFGIARASSSKTISLGNNTMGSVYYFSPEQAKGGYVTFKSDIYSLGLVIFEMITGKLPFEADTVVAVAIKQINDPLPDIKKINPNVSERLQEIIIHATEKFSSRRYESMKQMENDLRSALLDDESEDIKVRKKINHEKDLTVKINADDIKKIKEENQNHIESNLSDSDFDEDENEVEDIKINKEKKSEKRVVILALITSCIIISLFCFWGYKNLFNARMIEAPELIGKTQEEAEVIAKNLGVKIKKIGDEYNSAVEKNKISSQNYNPGDDLYKGDVINIKMSLGVAQISMPDVVNKDLSDAYDLMKDYFFDVDEIYEYSSRVPNNVVIKQKPIAGEIVDENSKVILYISRGQEIKNVIVPNVIGLSESEAKNKLQAENLIVGTITKSESNKYPVGIVLKQTVSAGKEVQTGTVVSFVISSGPEKIITPSATISATPKIIITPSESVVIRPTQSQQEEIIEPSEIINSEPKSLIVNPVLNLAPDVKTVRVKILRLFSGVAETFFEQEVDVDSFPLKFNIPKEKSGEYRIYITDEDGNSLYQNSSNISF